MADGGGKRRRLSSVEETHVPKAAEWACTACTFLNGSAKVQCDICGTPSPTFTSQISTGETSPTKEQANLKKQKPSRSSSDASNVGDVLFKTQKTPVQSNRSTWPKVAGELIALGYATRSGSSSSMIRPGDAVTIQRVAPNHVKKGKHKEDVVVRFSSRGSEVGRLPLDVARWMALLLDYGQIEVTGVCVDCPSPRISMMDQVMLQLSVMVPWDAVHSDEPPDLMPADVGEHELKNLQALQQMLVALGLREPPETVTPVTLSANTETDEGSDVEEDDELTLLTERMGGLDQNLPEYEPEVGAVGMRSELRCYQKQALSWLRDRELLIRKQENMKMEDDDNNQIHPNWKMEIFKDGDRTPWYWNTSTGIMSTTFPAAAGEARGGILADAMGLGKTIQILALIVTVTPSADYLTPPKPSDRNLARKSWPMTSSGLKQPTLTLPSSSASSSSSAHTNATVAPRIRSAATLVVGPMALLSQWREEALKHTSLGESAVVAYYGPDRCCDASVLQKATIVITTYGVVSAEHTAKVAGRNPLLFSIEFFRIVLDEAHFIKNRLAVVSKACCELKADRRWVLTGTPIQNRIDDLYSLFKFLRVAPWCIYQHWNKHITATFEKDSRVALEVLQGILRPVLLRRTKDTKDKTGKPILILPSSKIDIVRLKLTTTERDFYDAIYARSKRKFDEMLSAGSVLSNYTHILEILLRLRQSCDHPCLTLQKGSGSVPAVKSTVTATVFADIDELVSKFMLDSEDGNNGITSRYAEEVVQQLKALDAPTTISSTSSSSSSTSSSSPSSGVKAAEVECTICLETPTEPVVTPCAHIGCDECFTAVIREIGMCPVCRNVMSDKDLVRVRTQVHKNAETASSSSKPTYKPSTKLQALGKELNEMLAEDSDTKCIIFSQWTSMLDLVETVMKKEKIRFLRIDGSYGQQERENILNTFRTEKDTAMLMTLRVGGVGLNLTVASRVFLIDPWWNPQVENQAIDRVHRMGQKKEVRVKRFIIQDSIEERILELQEKKRNLASAAFSSKAQSQATRLSDLKLLLS